MRPLALAVFMLSCADGEGSPPTTTSDVTSSGKETDATGTCVGKLGGEDAYGTCVRHAPAEVMCEGFGLPDGRCPTLAEFVERRALFYPEEWLTADTWPGLGFVAYRCSRDGDEYEVAAASDGFTGGEFVFEVGGPMIGEAVWQDTNGFVCADGCTAYGLEWGIQLGGCVPVEFYASTDF